MPTPQKPSDLIYPQDGLYKKDVIGYYRKISPYLLPHIKGRPIVMHRFPGTILEGGFYHKNTPDFFPSSIERAHVVLKKGGTQDLVTIDDKDDLAYLAKHRSVSLHAWMTTTKHINHPDKVVLDLDPHGTSARHLKEACFLVRSHLESFGLEPLIMTSGSKGYHIVCFIKPEHSFETIHTWIKTQAQALSTTYPELFTTQMSIKKRGNRIFVDYLRNSYGQTSVAPYSLRALPGAPVATPITWQELTDPQILPRTYTIKNIFTKLKKDGDAWKDWKKSISKLKL